MEVVKEAAIVIICMLNPFLNLLKDNYLHKCIFNTLNLNNKNDSQAAKMILENINVKTNIEVDKDKEEIEGQDQKIEKEETREKNNVDRGLHLQETRH